MHGKLPVKYWRIRFKKPGGWFFELYWWIQFIKSKICRFFEPYFWTVFIRWISVGFFNFIFELYWQIQFTNKVKNLPVFWTLFLNCIYLMNICRFFEPYLWTLFNEYLLVFWTLFVSCIDKKIKLKKPADLFDGYLPVFWTLFMNCIY